MDKSHLLSTPIVVRTLDVKDPFRTRDVDEEILGPEVPYLSAIGALMFLDGYMSDPHNGRSQTGYVFTSGGTAISWRSVKQTIAATSSNHAKILAIYEASRECVCLRNATQHIRRSCGISSENEASTVLYEDNAACIAQLKEGCIKGDRTKHILPKFFSLMTYKRMHENLLSLLGFCTQGGEMVLVYEHASNGSLDKHLNDATLTWAQRIKICLDAAKGLSFLHDPQGTHQRLLHCDIKSSNILLNEKLNAKVYNFGSKLHFWSCVYMETYSVTKESDVYSFGVVMLEVLCRRLCVENSNGQLKVFVPVWKESYEQKKLDEIIFEDLKQQMDPSSLDVFTDIAFQCLQTSHEERPTMSLVVEKLEIALEIQEPSEGK
ncbi:kinase-like domain, phloem protein 2-like protein [Tanacetum coccineum]